VQQIKVRMQSGRKWAENGESADKRRERQKAATVKRQKQQAQVAIAMSKVMTEAKQLKSCNKQQTGRANGGGPPESKNNETSLATVAKKTYIQCLKNHKNMARNCQSKKEQRNKKKFASNFLAIYFPLLTKLFTRFLMFSPLQKCKNNKEKWRRNI